MTNEQARALVIADELLDGMSDEHWNQLKADAAAMLRRQEALLRQALWALEYSYEHLPLLQAREIEPTIQRLKDHS